MSKELQALERIKSHYKDKVCIDVLDDFDIIETALKKYEEPTSKPIMLCGRTHGYTQALIDYICKNYKEVKITNLVDEKKRKAVEVIKEKKWLIEDILNAFIEDKEKYDLLKEVFK